MRIETMVTETDQQRLAMALSKVNDMRFQMTPNTRLMEALGGEYVARIAKSEILHNAKDDEWALVVTRVGDYGRLSVPFERVRENADPSFIRSGMSFAPEHRAMLVLFLS